MSRLLTHSRLKTARQCGRLHWLKYVLGYRPTEDRAELFFGALIHLALEAWWLAVKAGVPVDAWLEAANAALKAAPGVDAFDLVRAEVMIFGYHARWFADAALYEVLGVEEQFEFPLINPATGGRSHVWTVAGKLDVRVRRRSDGTIGFIEHKTSSEDVGQGSLYWRRLRLDGQVSIYFDGCESLDEQLPAPEWCLYDVLAKPGQRPAQTAVLDEHGQKVVLDGKGERVKTQAGKWRQTGDTVQGFVLQTRPETPEEYRIRLLEALLAEPERYFHRGEVVRLESELAEARSEIWQQAAQLREDENADRHPRNPEACCPFGKPCRFFGVCTGESSLEDPSLFTRSENVHPELAPAVREAEQSTQGAA